MKFREKQKESGLRCSRCGRGVAFDGIVDLGDDDQPEYQTWAAFRCPFCGHGFVDLVERRRALILESQARTIMVGVP